MKGVDDWVRRRNDIDWDVVLAAVGLHHLKFCRTMSLPRRGSKPSHPALCTDDQEFQDQLFFLPLIREAT